MSFIQLIEVRTTRYDEIQALEREWERATEGKRTLRREIVCRDRNDPERFVMIAFFDSYESAMENSALPETEAISSEFAALVDGPMGFRDLDVVEDVVK
jgi:quinol monooxygenase YgiN